MYARYYSKNSKFAEDKQTRFYSSATRERARALPKCKVAVTKVARTTIIPRERHARVKVSGPRSLGTPRRQLSIRSVLIGCLYLRRFCIVRENPRPVPYLDDPAFRKKTGIF